MHAERTSNIKPRLRTQYEENIIPAMIEEFSYRNKFQVPRIEKIVLNMGVGAGASDFDQLKQAQSELAIIVGQQPAITRARKSISNFKLRQGSPVGCKVTLRRAHMYEFLDRLISIAIPRIKDFRGLSATSFDKSGNYSFGILEQHIFPEIDIDKVKRTQGMHVTIVTTADDKEASRRLLQHFGFPFKKSRGE